MRLSHQLSIAIRGDLQQKWIRDFIVLVMKKILANLICSLYPVNGFMVTRFWQIRRVPKSKVSGNQTFATFLCVIGFEDFRLIPAVLESLVSIRIRSSQPFSVRTQIGFNKLTVFTDFCNGLNNFLTVFMLKLSMINVTNNYLFALTGC